MAVYCRNYPRPQFVRKDWQSLNGAWDFAFDDEDRGVRERWMNRFPEGRSIRVPFTYETAMSGIGEESVHSVVWYAREITAGLKPGQRLLLHFEGSDYLTQVWANGRYLGRHEGGYSRFTFDLTDVWADGQPLRLVVRAEDSLARDQPRGKQRYKHESWGCWYVQTTGIWKTVWLEWVGEQYLKTVENMPDAGAGLLRLEVEAAVPEADFSKSEYELETVITFEGRPVGTDRQKLRGSTQTMEVPVEEAGALRLWSPETPNLYDIQYRLYRDGRLTDTVDSYFGMRRISIAGDRIYLNGGELYLRMVLDQGYWRRSGLTPPDEEALLRDIELTLEYGYNGARKHQKIEDERYLYWCDVKGLLVWSEMAACYAYDSRAVERFTAEWTRIVRQNKNHPCIITWVPFNESWGIPGVKEDAGQQAFVNGIYYLTKALDPTRPVITNDGWEHTLSDILTLHDYREYGHELLKNFMDEERGVLNNRKSFSWYGQLAFAGGYAYRGQPVILSEYGGIALRSEEGWGYGEQVRDEEEFLKRFASQNEAIYQISYFTGFCYTQLTDVQQEVNGLVDMDRRAKLSPEGIARIRALNRRERR